MGAAKGLGVGNTSLGTAGSAQGPVATASSHPWLYTSLLCLLALFALSRFLLPALPRIFVGSRLRIGSVGLFGVRDLSWKSRDGSSTDGKDERATEVRIQRIYPALGRLGAKGPPPPKEDEETSSRAKGKQERTRRAKGRYHASHRSLFVVHVQGVRVRLPLSSSDPEAPKRREEHARAKEEHVKADNQAAEERKEKRLAALMRESGTGTPPDAPQAQSSQESPARHSEDSLQNDQKGVPVAGGAAKWKAETLGPTLRATLHGVARALLWLIASTLPLLVSLIAIEVDDVEAYLPEAETMVCLHQGYAHLSLNVVRDGAPAVTSSPSSIQDLFSGQMFDSDGRPSDKSGTEHDTIPSPQALPQIAAAIPACRAAVILTLQSLRVVEMRLPPRSSTDGKQVDGISATHGGRDRHGPRRSVPKAQGEVLLAMPHLSSFEVGFRIGSKLAMTSREALDLEVDLSDIVLGLEPFYRVVRIVEERKAIRTGPVPAQDGTSGHRSKLSRHVAQQDSGPAAAALTLLRSASLDLPKLTVISSSKPREAEFAHLLDSGERERLPSALTVAAVVERMRFEVGTSAPADTKHQRWLGTCGHANYSAASGERSAADTDSKVELVEHRRAFQAELKLASLDVYSLMGDKQNRSSLLHLTRLSLHCRTTWTPFGLYPSSSEGREGAERFFQGDPNEQALVGEASLSKIRGHTDFESVAAIAAFAQMRLLERKILRKKLNLEAPPARAPQGTLHQLPKMSLNVDLRDFRYCVDAAKKSSGADRLALVSRIPRITYACHGSYRDTYARRSDAERRAAWQALRNNQLEWQVKKSPPPPPPRPTRMAPARRMSAAAFTAIMGKMKRRPTSETVPTVSSEGKDSSEMASPPLSPTIIPEGEQSFQPPTPEYESPYGTGSQSEGSSPIEPFGRPGQSSNVPTRHNKVPLRPRNRSSQEQPTVCGVAYNFEAALSCSMVESFVVFSGKDEALYQDNGSGQDKTGHLKHRPLLTINSIEISATGLVPGEQEISNDRVTLKSSGHETRIKGSIEELDVELWHPSVVQWVHRGLTGAQDAGSHLKSLHDELSALAEKKDSAAEATAVEPSDDPSDTSGGPPQNGYDEPFINRIPSGLDVWFSIGGILAHVGTNDKRCDPHIWRGIGLEARRVVLEFASSKRDFALISSLSDPSLGVRIEIRNI